MSRPIKLARFGLLAAIAGLTAGCSADAMRMAGPQFTGSTGNQQAIIGGGGQYSMPAYTTAYPSVPPQTATVGSSVVRQPLEPQPASPAPVYETTTYSPPPAAAAAAPKAYTPPSTLAPQTLNQQAARLAEPRPSATVKPGGTYRVQAGDSLWAIARANGTTTEALMAANGLSGPDLKIGQSLVIAPAGSTVRPVQVASIDPSAAIAPVPPVPKAPALPKTVSTPRQAEPVPSIRPPATDTAVQTVETAQPDLPDQSTGQSEGFRWPVRGRIIAGFGPKPNGEKNDGINLAVPEGTSVKAAEDGVVIYAGNELKSYGNLVLIRHQDGWVSAYAHSRSISVKRGEEVRRGQIIGEAGMTGSVTSPQVHFELRKGSTPVNPLDHLSEA